VLGSLLAAGMFVALAGCAAAPDEPSASESAPAESDFLACAVSDEGSWNDKSFNEAAFDGLLKAEDELGIEISDAESESAEDFVPNLDAMVSAGCDLTFAVGFNFSLGGTDGVIFDVANANADSNFAWLDGWPGGDEGNVKPIMYATEQSSYLAGYLAAAYSTSKTIGTYGGLQIDSVTAFMDGYYQGAKKYEEETGTPVTVLGWDPDSATGQFVGGFDDTGTAKSISEGQLADGADVIFPVAGGLFTATAEAIRDKAPNAVLLGVDKDIAVTQPQLADITLTSVEKRMTQAVFDIIAESAEGSFSADPYFGTLENDGTGLSEFYDFDSKVSDDVKAALEDLKAQIIAGDIEIPLTVNPS
jgi:basic membrane protein A